LRFPRSLARREADGARPSIQSLFTEKQQAFLNFVLDHYIDQGTRELDTAKLSELVKLRYNSTSDAVLDLGATSEIREIFTGFQKFLYQSQA
jgi:type I restriction enzyme R subunit